MAKKASKKSSKKKVTKTVEPTSTDLDTAEGASVEAEGPRDNGYESPTVGTGCPQEAEVETGGQWPSAEVISLEDRTAAAVAEIANKSAPNSDGDLEQEHGPEESDVGVATESAGGGFMEQAINEVLRRNA